MFRRSRTTIRTTRAVWMSKGMKEQLRWLRFVREDLGLITRAKPRDIRSE